MPCLEILGYFYVILVVLLRLSKLAPKPRFFSNIKTAVLGFLLTVSVFLFWNSAALES